MPLANCERCGRMFQTIAGIKICSRCRENDDEIYKVVKDYVYDNPGVTIDEVSAAVDVPEKMILKFLREGRLETQGEAMLIECEKCGAPIKSGKFCNKCTKQMTMGLKEAAKNIQEHIEPRDSMKEKKSIGHGMHTKKR